VRTAKGIVITVASIVTAAFLLFVPLSAGPCQQTGLSQGTCHCCLDSLEPSYPDDTEHHECPCQMCESQQEQSPGEAIVSHFGGGPESAFDASVVEVITRDHQPQLASLYFHRYSSSSKDTPLYLLHASFLI
jgi:hypothetical protein